MSDLNTVAPAGASEQSLNAPMDRATAVGLLGSLDDPPEEQVEAGAAGASQESVTPQEDGVADNAARDQGEAQEQQGTDDTGEAEADLEAAGPDEDQPTEAEAPEEEQYVHGNAKTRLRDGTVTTVADLKRLADEAKEYRAKLPDLAQAQTQVQEHAERVKSQEQLFQQIVPTAWRVLQTFIPPEPDPALRQTDPLAHYEQWSRREEMLGMLRQIEGGLSAHAQATEQQQSKAREAQERELLTRNRQLLLEKIPEVADPVKRKAVYDGFIKTAMEYGFGQDDVNNVTDPRVLHMVFELSRKAAAWDKFQAQKSAAEKKTGTTPPVQRPGARVSQEQAAEKATAERFQRWARGGADRAGAAAILGNLD